MTRVDFHFNTPDRLQHACRLIRKALRSEAATSEKPLVVVCDQLERLVEFDELLYSFSDDDFLPHVFIDHPMADEAPVVLSPISWVPGEGRTPALLLNLGDTVPDCFSSYDRVFEVVGPDEADRALARQRFTFYRDRGYTLTRHDLGHAPS